MPSCAESATTGSWSSRTSPSIGSPCRLRPCAGSGTARFTSLTEGRELDAAADLAVEPYGFLILRPLSEPSRAAYALFSNALGTDSG